MKVTIKLINRLTEMTIIADDEKNEVLVNGNLVLINAQKFVSQISILTSSWQPTYINNAVIDGEEFMVKLQNQNKVKTYTGKNKFPINYSKFLSLISEVKQKWNY